MGRLIYPAIAPAEGYVDDAGGSIDGGAPDEEVHRFVNDLERPVGTCLYGRRMYETVSPGLPATAGCCAGPRRG
jgi:hypothetical protein